MPNFKVVAVAALVSLACMACSAFVSDEAESEKLFFAMRIEAQGRLIAKPHLLGETACKLSMQLVDPEQPDRTRLALELLPTRERDSKNGYEVSLGLRVAGHAQPHVGHIRLMHGEERRIQLQGCESPVSVTLMLMRVDSPEFAAWMELVRKEQEKLAS